MAGAAPFGPGEAGDRCGRPARGTPSRECLGRGGTSRARFGTKGPRSWANTSRGTKTGGSTLFSVGGWDSRASSEALQR
eukprot:4031694-Pyramimonas_sp.AAC.1